MWRYSILFVVAVSLLTTTATADDVLIFGGKEGLLLTGFQLVVSDKSFSPILQGPIEDNSTAINPTNQSGFITFTVNADDPDGNQWYILICNGTGGTSSGNCAGNELCRGVYMSSGVNGTCQFNTSSTLSWNVSWFGYACNNESYCSTMDNSTSPFFVNHAPTASPTHSWPSVTSTA